MPSVIIPERTRHKNLAKEWVVKRKSQALKRRDSGKIAIFLIKISKCKLY
jgi:hypothetical protein